MIDRASNEEPLSQNLIAIRTTTCSISTGTKQSQRAEHPFPVLRQRAHGGV